MNDETTTEVPVLLYSSNALVREAVRLAVGKRPCPGLPKINYHECATHDGVLSAVAANHFKLLILDGEAQPSGGMGLCRQLKNEIFNCPNILVLTGRQEDSWLATWSLADAAVPHPLDPVVLVERVTTLLSEALAETRS